MPIGVNINPGDLLGAIFGTSTSTTGASSGTSNTAQLQGNQQNFDSRISDLLQTLSDTLSTSAATTASTKSKATAAAGTSQTNQTQGLQQQQSSDEITSSSNEAIDAAKAVINTANSNAANAGSIAGTAISDTLRKAALAFGPTTVQANQTGAYNTTSTDLLRGNAEAQAAADAASTVLNYQTAQQKIASDATQNLLAATKVTKGATSGATSGNSATGTSTAQTGQEINADVTQQVQQSHQQVETVSAEQKSVQDLVASITGVLTNAQQTTQSTQTQDRGGLSVICTELMYQGKMRREDWVNGMRTFNTYSELSRQGYWAWATPLKNFITLHPTSRITWLAQHTFCARAKGQVWAKLVIAIPSIICGLAIGTYRWDLAAAHIMHRPAKWLRRWKKEECF